MKVHLQVDGAPTTIVESIHDIETAGADGIFTFEGQHDVFFPLVIAAGETDLELMTNVAIASPRSPLHLAHAAYDLQVLSRGRFRLGLGSQVRAHIEKRYGSDWGRPAHRLAESVSAIKAIFDAWEGRSRLDFRGQFYTHTLMAPSFDPGPNPYGPPPVLMGALGPIMTRKAAEVADGLLVMPFNSARHFHERTLPALAAGFERSGRDPAQFAIVAQAMVAVGRDDVEISAAVEGVATLIAFYGSTPAYLPVLEVHGWDHIQPQLNALSKKADFTQMRRLITDEILQTLGVVGDPAQCATEINRRFGAHAGEVCCYFPGYRPRPEHVADLVGRLRT